MGSADVAAQGTGAPEARKALVTGAGGFVGASLAGSAAAILLGRAGARVALVEKRPDPSAFKRVCSHYIQSSAAATLERLGLLEEIEQAGGGGDRDARSPGTGR